MRNIAQLIVITLLVGTAVGLFLPATQKVRDTGSRRTRCSNNLKQLGLALHQYHDTHFAFPPGTIANAGLSHELRLSWIVAVLPFMEQDNVYSAIDTTQAWNADASRTSVHTQIATFYCRDDLVFAPPNTPPWTNYVGIAGVGADAAILPKEDPRAGLFGYNRQVAMKEITDGTANTIILIETSTQKGPWAAGGRSTVRGLDQEQQPYLGSKCQFGSSHTGGTNVCLGDASVRFIDQRVSQCTFEALATIAGGEVLGSDF